MSRLSSFPLFVDGLRVTVYSVTAVGPSNPPIVFLHGWGLSPQSYKDYLERLSISLDADIIAPALPGFGGSDPLPGAADLNHLIGHFDSALGQLQPDAPPIMIGHSLGAGLAARVAESTQEQLDPRIVLISPAGVHSQGKRARGAAEALTMALDLRYELPHSPLDRIRDAGPSFLRHPRAVFQAGWTASQMDIRESLSKLNGMGKKVFVITADGDRVTPYEAAISIPDVRVERVHGTHGWVLSAPDEAAKVTTELLRGDEAKGR